MLIIAEYALCIKEKDYLCITNDHPSDIQTDKQVVDAHREKWRCTCVGTYRHIQERGGGVHQPASEMDCSSKTKDCRTTKATGRLLPAADIDHKGSKTRGNREVKGIGRTHDRTPCKADGRLPHCCQLQTDGVPLGRMQGEGTQHLLFHLSIVVAGLVHRACRRS